MKKIRGTILNILFASSALSLFFYKNMLYIHIITLILMLLMLIKSYNQGFKNGLIWLSLVILPMARYVLEDSVLTKTELSEILLIFAPSITAGLLAERQRQYVNKLKETYISTPKALAEATDARDSYTQGHSERVTEYAIMIAKELGLATSEIDYLRQAALLHDIGKIAVPDNILHKKEPLDNDDWSIIKKHPEYSKKILSNLNFLSQTLPIILLHHHRPDGKGYPIKEAETKVPLAAKILTVADAFDAMTSDRPYRNRLNPEQALEELEKGSGAQFDPEVVMAFKRQIIRKDY